MGKKDADNTAKKVGKPFKAGPEWTGNASGRPKGARNRLSEDFLKTLADDFEANGKKAVEKIRGEDPGKYLSIIAQVIPKETDVTVNASDAFVKLWETVAAGTFNAMAEDIEQSEGRAH